MFKTAPALLALCATLVAAAPAAADSIAYVKDGDVWLASPDGSRQQQVTKTGTYSYVSQADDGTMAALAPGETIHRLSRTGEVLSEIATYVSDGAPQAGPVTQFAGPFNPEISPDGTKIAFEWMNSSYYDGGTAECNIGQAPSCYDLKVSQGVGITYADRFTGFEEFGLLTGWIGPHWLSNDRLLRSNANVSPNEDAVINTIGPGKGDDDMKRWFWDDNGASGVEEVELARTGKVAAGVAGYESDELRVYRLLYDPMSAPEQKLGPFEDNPQVVEPCIGGKNDSGRIENLSFSPDGTGLAYGIGEGIWVMRLPDISGGCGTPASDNRLVIPGGRHPHWGPADIPPPSAYAPRAPDQPDPPVTPAGAFGVAAGGKRVVKVTTPGAGRISVVAKKGTKRVARASRTVTAAGAYTLRLRPARRARRGTAKALVTFRPAGGGPAQKASARVRL
ncbi:MAG TPA: hypothetical protein VF587_13625 [Solirubrobacteraceae bacterium]|jgi:hypothetical protein